MEHLERMVRIMVQMIPILRREIPLYLEIVRVEVEAGEGKAKISAKEMII